MIKNTLITTAVAKKRLAKTSKDTGIEFDLLFNDFKSRRELKQTIAMAYESVKLGKENNIEPRTVFAQFIVQTGVADLCKNVEILHKRVTAFHTVMPARQFQYSLQDLVSIVDHLGDFLKHGPKEPDSEVPLSASMVPEEIPEEEREEIEENLRAFEKQAEEISSAPVESPLRIVED